MENIPNYVKNIVLYNQTYDLGRNKCYNKRTACMEGATWLFFVWQDNKGLENCLFQFCTYVLKLGLPIFGAKCFRNVCLQLLLKTLSHVAAQTINRPTLLNLRTFTWKSELNDQNTRYFGDIFLFIDFRVISSSYQECPRCFFLYIFALELLLENTCTLLNLFFSQIHVPRKDPLVATAVHSTGSQWPIISCSSFQLLSRYFAANRKYETITPFVTTFCKCNNITTRSFGQTRNWCLTSSVVYFAAS